ncbi:MAG: hypothetical protein C4529_08040 [Deltaproteobacteria bacterium]|nr:MAG: hypothetical protein C4529_08040 [Deltaproteobacteria bacterium]
MDGVKGDPTNELDRMVREDMVLGEEIAKLTRARDMRIRFIAQQIREESEPFDRKLAPLQEKRDRLRQAILAIWTEHHDGETTLDLPCARVSRRNYRELVVHDKEALLDALDRADRLDLVDHVFDDKAVARLIADGKVRSLPDGAAKVIDHHNLQVRPRKET